MDKLFNFIDHMINPEYSQTTCSAEGKALTVKDIEKAIEHLGIISDKRPVIKEVHEHSRVFRDLFKRQEKKEYGICETIYGFPVLHRTYIPKGEVWFLNQKDKLMKRFKFPEHKEDSKYEDSKKN